MSISKNPVFVRKYSKGTGEAVANRTINRRIEKIFKRPATLKLDLIIGPGGVEKAVSDWCAINEYILKKYIVENQDSTSATIKVTVSGQYVTEEWEDVANRVAFGNSLLCTEKDNAEFEFNTLHKHLLQASILLSGRHLQHGDSTQPTRNGEVMINCATSAASFLTFYLLLNGSGVGRAYDDDMMLVDWSYMPTVVNCIDRNHKDVQSGEISALDLQSALHLYKHKDVNVFTVPDSREGWAKAIETMEVLAYRRDKKDSILILDFSKVRPKGSPINGMQNRPASGPGPLMDAITNAARVKESGMAPWRQALYVDQYLAECVLVGGARRAARMSTKYWKDEHIFEFIEVKRGGFLWSSNNSVTVDEEFWALIKSDDDSPLGRHAKEVLNLVTYCAYHDNTGEPGLINQDKLKRNDEGFEQYLEKPFVGSKKYTVESESTKLLRDLAKAAYNKPYNMIVNPCGEITLSVLGGYCVIGDVVPYHAQNDLDAEEAFRTTVRALIRVNTMDVLYGPEVARTNRIGVGITGLYEYAWKRFGYGWKDLIDEEKSKPFWLMLSKFKRAVKDEAEQYSRKLGLTIPHTDTTIKPAGTTSKLFGLTEGAHLPSQREYIRWVQFRSEDPLVKVYEDLGYPVRKLQVYKGTTIVGFPTRHEICKLGMGNKLIISSEATPEEQYTFLLLLEKYWLRGVDENGNLLEEDTGNQISYTLKYDRERVSYEEFKGTLVKYQSLIKCCSVLPLMNTGESAYEYLPEQSVNKHEYEQILNAIKDGEFKEDIGLEHVDCSTGACPIDFREKAA